MPYLWHRTKKIKQNQWSKKKNNNENLENKTDIRDYSVELLKYIEIKKNKKERIGSHLEAVKNMIINW